MERHLGRALRRVVGYNIDDLLKVETREGGVSLFMNETRQRIFEYVYGHPGAHHRLTAGALGMSLPTMRWHSDLLVEAGFILTRAEGNRKQYFPESLHGEKSLSALAMLASAKERTIYAHLSRHPGSTQAEVCRATRIYQQSTAFSLKKLEGVGLVHKESDRRRSVYAPTGLLDGIIKAARERLPEYKTWLLGMLEEDGVRPELASAKGLSLTIRVSTGQDVRTMRLRPRSYLF